MTTIISYQKYTDEWTTYTLVQPHQSPDSQNTTELCTIDGVTYVAVPDGVTLPDQPSQIADNIKNVELTAELISAIKTNSSHCKFISDQVQHKIRQKYTMDDEMYFSRIASAAALGVYELKPDENEKLMQYNEYVESVRIWAKQERIKLGLD
jgi:hypothetical protein